MIERKLLAKFRVGSHLYGLSRPESDIDYNSVFYPNPEDLFGLKPIDEIDNSTKKSDSDRRNTKDDIDYRMYSLTKYIVQILRCNPNMTELLFAPEDAILETSIDWMFLVENRDKFISQVAYDSFMGYAKKQEKKLITKKERYDSIVLAIKYLEDNFPDLIKEQKSKMTFEIAELLNKMVKHYKGKKNNCNSFQKGHSYKTTYDLLVHERDNYGWRVKTDTFMTLGYDVKFAYHIIRLLDEGTQLLTTGKIEYPIGGKAREDIVKIRDGKVSYEGMRKIIDFYKDRMDDALKITQLPEKPDYDWAEKQMVGIIHEHLRSID